MINQVVSCTVAGVGVILLIKLILYTVYIYLHWNSVHEIRVVNNLQ